MNRETRGERNRNPGNIDRNSTVWKGMAREQEDSRFITFESPEYGIRAIAKIILTYHDKYGYDTVREIIDRWAPPEENDTSSYINHVASDLSVDPDDKINVQSPQTMEILVRAIIAHENGRVIYDDKTIQDGIDMALT